jgi:ATP-dependent DNA ligase
VLPFPLLLSRTDGRHGLRLSGELVAWRDDGRPDFSQLFARFPRRSPRPAWVQNMAETPVTWVAFDLCYL